MTDEEMAEERATEFTKINFNEPDNYGSEKEVGHFSYYTGFLAGLKTGKPKWHDLREDSNDLPKKNGRFFVTLENGLTKFSYYYHSEKKFTIWNKEYGNNIKLHNVIAWYEIPRFEGVE